GHCLCASAVRNGMRLISVVINSPDSKTRFKECSNMFNYGFDNYQSKTIIKENTPLDITVNVEKGKKSNLTVVGDRTINIISKKNQERCFEINFIPLEKVKAPIVKGEKVGELKIYENGIELQSVNVLSNEDIQEKTYFDCLFDVFNNWALY
ncbi:MAG: D-alanyl-D-alanine carboxypeptidase, partial [Clostridia bacterium]|nr:D-alanyl-D-alanine carboxypeptidase [Clostridia bacterium]